MGDPADAVLRLLPRRRRRHRRRGIRSQSGEDLHPPRAQPRKRPISLGGEADMASNQDLIGREDINDLEAILAITNTDVDAAIHTVRSNYDTIFTWDYEKGARPKLNRLYEKAKTSMRNRETDLPWETEVDQEAVVLANTAGVGGPRAGVDLTGPPFEKWNEKDWINFGVESQNWTLSQFMHGEQGALVCTAK